MKYKENNYDKKHSELEKTAMKHLLSDKCAFNSLDEMEDRTAEINLAEMITRFKPETMVTAAYNTEQLPDKRAKFGTLALTHLFTKFGQKNHLTIIEPPKSYYFDKDGTVRHYKKDEA